MAEITVAYYRHFGWVASLDEDHRWDGPIVIYHDPWRIERAVAVWALRFNERLWSWEVEGYDFKPFTRKPYVDWNGQPVHRTLHLRRVLDVVMP